MTRRVRITASVALILAGGALSVRTASAGLPEDKARTLLAQAVISWDRGDLIRVTSLEPHPVRWTGRFHGLDGDSVLSMSVPGGDGLVLVRAVQMGRLEEKIGTKRYWAEGALVGSLVGVWIGASVTDDDPEFSETFDRLFSPMIGAGVGLVGGGVIGYLIKTNRWGIVATFD